MDLVEQKRHPETWALLLIAVSILAHLLIGALILLLARMLPATPLPTAPKLSGVSLEYITLPKTPSPPRPHSLFIPTRPDLGAPVQQAPFESDNDVRLHSKSKLARDLTSILPDVTSPRKQLANLQETPEGKPVPPAPVSPPSPNTADSAPSPTRPTPPAAVKSKPSTTPPPPLPQQADQAAPPGTAITPKPPPRPALTPPKIVQEYDPNGLPILPQINAPAMAPAPTGVANPTRQASGHPAEPSGSFAAVKSDTEGATGLNGDNTPSAMATEFGRYKAKVYNAVGSLWHQKIRNELQILPIGTVHIHIRIHSDGSVETQVINDTGSDPNTTVLLRAASLNAITESANFDPFSPTLAQQIGDSYDDDFSFSIYGE